LVEHNERAAARGEIEQAGIRSHDVRAQFIRAHADHDGVKPAEVAEGQRIRVEHLDIDAQTIAGRDAILTMKDGILKLATAEGDKTLTGSDITAPYFTAVRDALDHWRQGAAPLIGVHDCLRAVRLIDQAYERAR